MAVNNYDVQAESGFTPDGNETDFMEVTDSAAVSENPVFSGNGFYPKNGFSNTNDQAFMVQNTLRSIPVNTSTESDLHRKESEEEFTIWPKRRIKLQGQRFGGCKVLVINAEDRITQTFESESINTTEETKMEYSSTECFSNHPEEHPSSAETLASNSELNTSYRKNILDLPDLVLEHILGYVDLNDLSKNVRPVCRMFFIISSRILRRMFKNIHTQLNSTLKELEKQHPNNWNPLCAEVLTCKLLESEMETLRAACSRQIESGLCFAYGDVLQEYNNILHTIRSRKLDGMLDGFSDTLIKLNERPLKYWDNRYEDDDMTIGELKLFGVEITEVLLSALNASGCIVVTYQPTFTCGSSNDDKEGEDASGSCMMAGYISIDQSTELKAPPTDHISLNAQRRAILRYIRSLVRANNCDIVLHKLRVYSKEKESGKAQLPVFQPRAWTLCHSKVLNRNMVQESYKKESITEHMNTSQPDCNMYVLCSFELICPKRVNPFGLPLDTVQQSTGFSEDCITEEQVAHGSRLAETLCGDHYNFKMAFKTFTPSSREEYIIQIENYATKTNRWFLSIDAHTSSI